MKIKSINLDGLALDYAVALCAGKTARLCVINSIIDVWLGHSTFRIEVDGKTYNPSANWGDAGDLMHKHSICMERAGAGFASIVDGRFADDTRANMVHGPTQLVSAMRCVVVDVLGSEVNIPDVLVLSIARQRRDGNSSNLAK